MAGEKRKNRKDRRNKQQKQQQKRQNSEAAAYNYLKERLSLILVSSC